MEGYTVLQRKKYLKSAFCLLLLTPLQLTPHTDKNNAQTENVSLLKSAAGFASAGLTITSVLAGFCTYNRDHIRWVHCDNLACMLRRWCFCQLSWSTTSSKNTRSEQQ